MNNSLKSLWSGFSASIIGSGHIKRGLPCQDASAAVTTPRPALIVCDGRGSASRSQDGASGAVRDFTSQCAVFEPLLATILDADEADAGRWEQFCRILYRTLMQTKLNLAAEHNVPEKEFDFTVAAAVVGTNWIGCFQVGDGAIVLRQNGTVETAFAPDKGEFANQTHFLRENGEMKGKFHAKLFSAKENSGIAITSDGPEHLMFHLATMTPGKIFNMLFDDMQSRSLTRQDIMDYLTRREWDKDPRGQDDRSIAILAPEPARQEAESEPDDFRNTETTANPGDIRQEVESEPLCEEEKTANEQPISEPPSVRHQEDDAEMEPSAPIYLASGNGGHEGQLNEAGMNRSEEPEHGSTENRNNLIPVGITGAAIIVLLFSTTYCHSEIKAMQRELSAISTRQTTVAEHCQQPGSAPRSEYLHPSADAAADVQAPGGTTIDGEHVQAEVLRDNNAVTEASLSAESSSLQQETETLSQKEADAADTSRDSSETEFHGQHPEE